MDKEKAKARAYDLIVQIQNLNLELQKLNQIIAEPINTETKEPSKL